MLLNLYVVYDKTALEASPIFQAKNDGVAWRQFQDLLNNSPQVPPEELKLLKLGQFDSETLKLHITEKAEEININLGMA